MIHSRRAFLMGAAALSAAVATPEMTRAAAALNAVAELKADWALATRDVEADAPRHALRLIYGRAPAGLEGVLYRNGPGRFRRPGGSATHWFDGDGLMRAFRIQDGQATLEARFVDTPKRRTETELDAVVTPGFGTRGDARARVGSNDDANAANTGVMPAGDRIWALWEGGSPLAMDAADLSTQAFVTLRSDLKGMPFQAHPRRGPDGSIWNVGAAGDRAVIWRLNPDGGLNQAEVLRLPRASYMHDFTATDRHLILVMQPWLFETQATPIINGLVWRPEAGTQVMVLDKDDLSRRQIYELPGFFHFHLGDAWAEADGTIRFDVAAAEDPRFAVDGARVLVEGQGTVPGDPATLALITLRPDGRAEMTRSNAVGEFPQSDPRRRGLKRRLTVHTGGETRGRPLPTGLALQDWETGRSEGFTFGRHQVVEEVLFAPKPGATAERDAWLIGPSINLDAGRTELHVFDAARIEDGPVVSWAADFALPAGFHGAWVG